MQGNDCKETGGDVLNKERKPAGGRTGLTVGLPQAMLYARYQVLWETFFRALGVKTITSGETNRQILERGSALAIDETCLSTKIFLGHVDALMGQCDYILIPRISNFGVRRYMCTKFEALFDMTKNVFHTEERKTAQNFLAYNIDGYRGRDEERAFVEMAMDLGFHLKDGRKAYKLAKKAEAAAMKDLIRDQEAKLKQPGIKILLCGHSYVTQDAYVGRTVTGLLEDMGVAVLRADLIEEKEALKRSQAVLPTLRWELNREIVAGVDKYAGKVDGAILMSVFPCGPDSMVNEMIARKFPGLHQLQLVIDGQDGLAGVETRLESFIDIIRFKGGTL